MSNVDNCWSASPPADCSWYWRTLHKLKLKMVSWYNAGRFCLTANGMYSVSTCYWALIGTQPKQEIVELIWCSVALPKHRFNLWLAAKDY